MYIYHVYRQIYTYLIGIKTQQTTTELSDFQPDHRRPPFSGRCLKGHVPGAQKVSENGGSPEFKALFVGKVLNNNKPQDLGVTGQVLMAIFDDSDNIVRESMGMRSRLCCVQDVYRSQSDPSPHGKRMSNRNYECSSWTLALVIFRNHSKMLALFLRQSGYSGTYYAPQSLQIITDLQ